ncbi:hypothetical protein Droror1_Dr00008462 [Drosera rotundifolia]
MPTYSFSCQTSYLTSMARAGFDFNTCIYDGISYLSRAQESVAKHHMGNPILVFKAVESAPAASVADQVFTERTKVKSMGLGLALTLTSAVNVKCNLSLRY